MKKLILLAPMFFLLAALTPVQAQEIDAAFGINTTLAPKPSFDSLSFYLASLRGGLYPSVSGDFLFRHHSQLGIQGEVAWRASQQNFGGGEPYRPIFWDFNAIWAPRFGKAATGELMGGIGAESSRFYQNGYVCGFTGCTNYVSYTHFMGHVGGGVRFYLHGGLFVRPEAHLYLVNNNQYFSSSRVGRVGVSLGYSFGR